MLTGLKVKSTDTGLCSIRFLRGRAGVSQKRIVPETCEQAPILPGLRYHDSVQKVVVFECSPSIKSCHSKYSGDNLAVSVPWEVYVIAYSYSKKGYYLTQITYYWRSNPLRGMGSWLGTALIPNVYSDSHFVCQAESHREYLDLSLSRLCSQAVAAIWSSGFNMDLHPIGYHNDGYSPMTIAAFPQVFRGVHRSRRTTLLQMFPTLNRPLADVVAQSWLPGDKEKYLTIEDLPTDVHGERYYSQNHITLTDAIKKMCLFQSSRQNVNRLSPYFGRIQDSGDDSPL